MNGREMLENLKNYIGNTVDITYHKGFDVVSKKGELVEIGVIEKSDPTIGVDAGMPTVTILTQRTKEYPEGFDPDDLDDLDEYYEYFDNMADPRVTIPIISQGLSLESVKSAENGELLLKNVALDRIGIRFADWRREQDLDKFLSTEVEMVKGKQV